MRKKFIETHDPIDVKHATEAYLKERSEVKKNKKAKREEQIKQDFKKANLSFINKDERLDDIEELSSSDDESNRDYDWVKSSASFDIS